MTEDRSMVIEVEIPPFGHGSFRRNIE
jgi:mono/diheme cytochrome c family protein